MAVFDDMNNEELIEEDINNCFTLTQNKNEDGLTFTECANESQVYFFPCFYPYIYIFIVCFHQLKF